MQMNTIHWIRRSLAVITSLCLAVTSFGVQPVQASPPAMQDYTIVLTWSNPWMKTICPDDYVSKPVFTVYPNREDAPLFIKNATSTVTATGVQVNNYTRSWPEFTVSYTQSLYIDFTAKKPGHASLDVQVNVGSSKSNPLHVDFEVSELCPLNVHGSVDITRIPSGMEMKGWQPVGSYDVSGMIKGQEDGSITGQGTASLYEDIFFTGGEDDITCNHTSPWQGSASVELEADSNAWENEDTLVLTLSTESMQVNITRVECKGEDGYGGGNSPAVSIASFDLKFNPLPSEGGSTSLGFQFPNGPGQYEMELIVTPAEAES